MTAVSVCITNYNYGRFVDQAIESCLAQTHADVETIVVDDGSTDDSLVTIKGYADRVTVIEQANAGQAMAMRRAFEAAHGEMVVFLDADDLLDPTTAARVAAAYQRIPDLGRVQWRMRVIGPGGEQTTNTFPGLEWKMPDGDLRDRVLKRRNYIWAPTSGNAFSRRALEVSFPTIPEELKILDVVLAETSPMVGRVVNLDGVGGSYRWHGENWSNQRTREDMGSFFRERIDDIVVGHESLRRVCDVLGVPGCPADPTVALDWAFAGYRLSSLKVDRANHPLPKDRPLAVALHGIHSVLTQPDYSVKARAKRTVWFASVAVAPPSAARKLISRAFLSLAKAPSLVATPGTDPEH